MGFGETIVALVGACFVFSIPLSAIWMGHQQKMRKLDAEARSSTGNLSSNDVTMLREELRQLRETTLSYDLSFDTALQRLEARTNDLEGTVKMITSTPDLPRISQD